jgi:hypothetical protein
VIKGWKKPAGLMLLVAMGLAGATQQGREAYSSAREFACIFQALGRPGKAGLVERVALSIMLARATPDGNSCTNTRRAT